MLQNEAPAPRTLGEPGLTLLRALRGAQIIGGGITGIGIGAGAGAGAGAAIFFGRAFLGADFFAARLAGRLAEDFLRGAFLAFLAFLGAFLAARLAGRFAAFLRAAFFAGRRAAFSGAHDLPEHRVIDVAAAVVAHGRSDVLGHARQRLDQVLRTLSLQRGMLLERGVEVVHVGRVMFAVVNLHRLRVDVRLERCGVVR